jgi:hypothetical protein
MSALAVVVVLPEDRLDELRGQARTLKAELDRLTARHRRCIEEATALESKSVLVEKARKHLEGLHGLRSAGSKVTDADVKKAEAALRIAHADADKAAPAIQGAKNAAAEFLTKAKAVEVQLASIRTQANEALRPVLAEFVQESVDEHSKAVDRFLKAHARHHGRVAAISQFALELGLGNCGVYPNGEAGHIDIPVTALALLAQNGVARISPSTKTADLRKEIGAAITEVRAELRDLLF